MEKPVQVKIHPHNKNAHLDIARDMLLKGSGLFTFTLRVSNGMIVDYVCMDSKKYVKNIRPK
jgi:hypothetical protein